LSLLWLCKYELRLLGWIYINGFMDFVGLILWKNAAKKSILGVC
jgi:hypothetical protein